MLFIFKEAVKEPFLITKKFAKHNLLVIFSTTLFSPLNLQIYKQISLMLLEII